MVGGNEYLGAGAGFNYLSTVELFPPPSSDNCFIPNMTQTQPRYGHSLSLLSGGRLVVCGGIGSSTYYDSCISWVDGNTTWTPLYTMRSHHLFGFVPHSVLSISQTQKDIDE